MGIFLIKINVMAEESNNIIINVFLLDKKDLIIFRIAGDSPQDIRSKIIRVITENVTIQFISWMIWP
jgi:hypothetical protein